jgi:alkylation response protein AidB-like acyl-CoA dehydrogenase
VLDRATALVPSLSDHAIATEQARRVSPEGFDALSEAGILRMCAPKKFGGDELDFDTQCRVLGGRARPRLPFDVVGGDDPECNDVDGSNVRRRGAGRDPGRR